MSGMQHYVRDDVGYLAWLSAHPDGCVINTYARPSRAYLKLHHAACSTISRLQPGARPSRTASTARSAAAEPTWKRTLTTRRNTRPCPLCP
jgi:hypothetical protein